MDKDKTAVQQIIDKFKLLAEKEGDIGFVGRSVIEIIGDNDYLALEKEQIINARQDGYESTYNSCESGCMGRQILEESNEQYYTTKYGKQS